MKHIFFIIFFLFLFCSCRTARQTERIVTTDTTRIITIDTTEICIVDTIKIIHRIEENVFDTLYHFLMRMSE